MKFLIPILFSFSALAQVPNLPVTVDIDSAHMPKDQGEKALLIAQSIWAYPPLRSCKNILSDIVDKLKLKSEADLTAAENLQKKISATLTDMKIKSRPANQQAMSGSMHWDLVSPYSCRLSVYQDLGQMRVTLPPTAKSPVFKTKDGEELFSFEHAVLISAEHDFDAGRSTLNYSATATALNQVFQDRSYDIQTESGAAKLGRLQEAFEKKVFATPAATPVVPSGRSDR